MPFYAPAGRTLLTAPCGPLCKKASTPRLLLLGRRPKPALLFLIAEKDPAGRLAKRLAPEPPFAGQIYFYTGILQLPTVGQVKCLYNSVKNKFYRRLQRGALNGKRHDKGQQHGGNGTLFYAVQNSTRVSVGSMIFQI